MITMQFCNYDKTLWTTWELSNSSPSMKITLGRGGFLRPDIGVTEIKFFQSDIGDFHSDSVFLWR